MVKLGEYSGCPQIILTVVETILDSIRRKVATGLPMEDLSSLDIDEDILFVDWWAGASKARLFRLSQNAFVGGGGGGEEANSTEDVDPFQIFLSNLFGWIHLFYTMAATYAQYSLTVATYFLKQHMTFEYFIGEPLIPTGGVIMLLLMLYNKRPKSEAMLLLLAAFLLQANPFYVLIAYAIYYLRHFFKVLFIAMDSCLHASPSGVKEKLSHFKKTKVNSDAMKNGKDILAYRPESVEQYVASLDSTMRQSERERDDSIIATTVDVILLGNDFSTLYTAGLLSQAGCKCLVLEPSNSQPIKVVAQSPDLPPVYFENMSVGDPLRTQLLFEKVLHVEGSNEQERVVLKPIGKPVDDFAHTVIRLKSVAKKMKSDEIVILRPPGQNTVLESVYESAGSSLPSNIAQRLKAENSNQIPSPFSAICRFFNYLHMFAYPVLSKYLMMKVGKNPTDMSKYQKDSKIKDRKNLVVLFFQSLLGIDTRSKDISKNEIQDIKNLGSLNVSGLLSQTLKSTEPTSQCIQQCYSHLSSIAATVGANEYLSPKLLSSINIPYALGQTKEGMFAPEGGCEAVFNSLYAVIRQAGGSVVHSVDIDTFIFSAPSTDHVAGVRLNISSALSSPTTTSSNKLNVLGTHGIVSGLGVMHTYQMLLGMRASSRATRGLQEVTEVARTLAQSRPEPRSLLNACEARPKLHCVFWIQAVPATQVSDIHSFDYFEYPAYFPSKPSDESSTTSPPPPGYLTSAAGSDDMDTSGVFVRDYVKIWSPSAKDAAWALGKYRNTHVVVVELEAGDEVVKKHIIPVQTTIPASPSASNSGNISSGYSNNSKGGVETETHAESVNITGYYACFLPAVRTSNFMVGGGKVVLSENQYEEVLNHARGKLFALYPHLAVATSGDAAFVSAASVSETKSELPLATAALPTSPSQVSSASASSSSFSSATERRTSGGRVVEELVIAGHAGGRKLSASCQKFSMSSEVQISGACEGFENMFMCGPDVSFPGLAGEMQGAWVAANSVLGFSREDVITGNNIHTVL